MLKVLRMMAAAAAVFATACATAPEPATTTEPERREPERPVEERRAAPLRVGVIVSGGSLRQYGDLVLEGAQVAAQAARTPRRDVELVVRQDDGTAAGAERALRELEQAGVEVVVGPLLDESLVAAARARRDDDVVLISPTAVSDPRGVVNAYALNVVDTRGAAALGQYAVRYGTVGLLYSRSPEALRHVQAFREAFGSRGTLVDAGFMPNATNVTQQIAQLRDGGVRAIFFPGNERELQVVLPQLNAAGLGDVQMLGTESWLRDALRNVRGVDGAIVATPLNRDSRDVAWSDFVQQYETLHRRSLTSPVAALGYDATTLALRALTGGNATVTDFRGATGVLSLRSGTVTRRPFLVRIEAGRLIPIN